MELWMEALLIGIWVSFALMGQLWGNYFPRSIVYAFGIGIIMGDIPNALLMGATAELVFMGFGMGAGGVAPPNNIGPGVFGTIWVINAARIGSSLDVQTALAMSFAPAFLVQFLTTFIYTASAPNPTIIGRTIDKGNWVAYKWSNNLTIIAFGIMGFILGLAAALSADLVKDISEWMQSQTPWLIDGMRVAGGMIPAVGFAMILSVMFKKQFIPFVLLGYICFAWLFDPTDKTWIMGTTLLALAVALIVLFAGTLLDKEAAVKKKGSAAAIDDAVNKVENIEMEEEDYSDGI